MPKFFLNDIGNLPKFAHPQLLAHPHIPRGLGGINPRTILGQKWWNETRRAAYAENNYCCHACGMYCANDPFSQPPEAHECYDIDHTKKLAVYRETVALCHCCHNFIHSGRLWALYRRLKISKKKVAYVIQTRLKICRANDVTPFYYALVLEKMLEEGISEDKAFHTVVYEEGVETPPSYVGPPRRWRLKLPTGKIVKGGF